MPFADVVRNLGDAVAGVDRNKAYIEGQQARADYDETQAQTDYAMEQARVRRLEAEKEEVAKRARERFETMSQTPDWDPGTANVGDLALAGMGSDYSGAMQGRNYGQQYQQRAIVGTPEDAMIGENIVTAPMRDAAMDALSPSSAIAMRRPRAPGAPTVVTDPSDPENVILIPNTGGDPITVNTPQGPVPARPAARPSATATGPTTQERNIEGLVARGVPEETAIQVVYDERPDPVRTYTTILNSTRLRYATDEEAEAAAIAAVEELYGVGALDAAQEPLIEEYAEGETLVNPQTGQSIVLRGGVWVDVATGQPVQ